MKKLFSRTFGILFIFSLHTSGALADEFRLAAMLPLTGDYAMHGAAMREGMEIAAEELNATGGILGSPVRLTVEDTAYSTPKTVTIAKKLLSDSGLCGVVIATYAETKASGPLFEHAHIPVIVLWDSTPELEKMGDYIFGIGPWSPSTYEVAAQFAREKLQGKKAAVLTTQNEWSNFVGKGFEEAFQGRGGKIVFSSAFVPGESDFRTILFRAKATNPDVLYAPVTDRLDVFFRQVKEVGWSGPVVTSDNLNDEVIATAPANFEGVYQTMVADPSSERVEHLQKAYEKHFGHAPGLVLFSAWGYDAVKLFSFAAQQKGKEPNKLKEGMYEVKNFPGASGNISISPEGSSRMNVSVFQVTQGKLSEVR